MLKRRWEENGSESQFSLWRGGGRPEVTGKSALAAVEVLGSCRWKFGLIVQIYDTCLVQSLRLQPGPMDTEVTESWPGPLFEP